MFNFFKKRYAILYNYEQKSVYANGQVFWSKLNNWFSCLAYDESDALEQLKDFTKGDYQRNVEVINITVNK